MAIEELSQGDFLTKAIETPKVWHGQLNGQDIIEFEAWVSTEDIDRDGEIIRVAGWRKPSLQKAKLLLFHDYDNLPIGKPYWTRAKEEDAKKGLYTRGRFGPQMHGLACGLLVENGDMDSFSVGFNWFKRVFDSEADGSKTPFYEYIDQELYEYSLVNVPSNPEATIAMERMLADAGDVKDSMAIIKSFKPQAKQTINRESYKIKEDKQMGTPEQVSQVWSKAIEIQVIFNKMGSGGIFVTKDRLELCQTDPEASSDWFMLGHTPDKTKDKEILASDIDAFNDDDDIQVDDPMIVDVDALDAEGDTLEVLVSVGDDAVDVEIEIVEIEI